MDYHGLLELVKKRRNIRSFKAEPIPDDYIDKIIEAARWAPSGANSQPWEFVVVRKKELKDSIVQFCQEQGDLSRRVELTREPEMRYRTIMNPPASPGYAVAPAFIILCGDVRTKDAYPASTTVSPRADSVLTSSLASAFLYMHLAATSLGLASQWVSVTANPLVQCLIKDLLKIPQQMEIYDTLAVGYPAYQPKPRLVRERADMVHYDYFDGGKFRTDEGIRNFILALRKQ